MFKNHHVNPQFDTHHYTPAGNIQNGRLRDNEMQPNHPLRTKMHYFPQGRNISQPKVPPNINLSPSALGYPIGSINPTNQTPNLMNQFPRRTAIPIPTSGIKTSTQLPINYNLSSTVNNQNPVPSSTISDPRLIHPAMEAFTRPKFDKRQYQKEKMIPKMKRNKIDLQKKMAFAPSRDEVEKYAVENSPSFISLRSSLSDLTIDGSVPGVLRFFSFFHVFKYLYYLLCVLLFFLVILRVGLCLLIQKRLQLMK